MKSRRLPVENPVYSYWAEWADSHAVSFFQTPTWGALLQEHFPEYTPAPVQSESFFIPLMRRHRWGWLSDSVYGMPMMTTGGVLAESLQEKDFWEGIFDSLARIQAGTMVLSFPVGVSLPASPQGFTLETATTHILDLSGGWEETWQGFDRDCRTAVRKAQRSGVLFKRVEGIAAVEAHWEIVRNQFAKWKPDPEPTFEFVRDASQCECGLLYQALYEGKAVVSLLAFFCAGEVFFWQGARSVDCPKGANNLLFSEAVRSACEEGFATINFGGSLGDRGIERFKEDFGAVKTPYAILKRTHPLVNLLKRGHGKYRNEEITEP